MIQDPDNKTLIISIETATRVCSVALHENGLLLGLSEMFTEKSHSRNLTVMIRDLMKRCGREINELDAVAVSKGPGSYTGLRIGSSAAKGLCFGCDTPLIAVDTLRAMAKGLNYLNTDKTCYIVPLLDARRMEVYTAVYDQNLQEVEPVRPEIIDENAYSDLLAKHQVIFGGNAAEKTRSVIKHANACFAVYFYTSAKFIGELAYEQWLQNMITEPAYFEPTYLKAFQVKKPKKRL